jgi:hypothetical protein
MPNDITPTHSMCEVLRISLMTETRCGRKLPWSNNSLNKQYALLDFKIRRRLCSSYKDMSRYSVSSFVFSTSFQDSIPHYRMDLSLPTLEQAALAVIAHLQQIPEFADEKIAVVGGMGIMRHTDGFRTTNVCLPCAA